jgi:hypothetical protein
MAALKAELEELRRAMTAAKVMAGEAPYVIINDPEEGLEEFVIPNLDQRVCYEIGSLTQPDDQ